METLIDHYFNLHLGGKKVRCTYYINDNYDMARFKDGTLMTDEYKFNYIRKKTKNRAETGKGTPEEIENLTKHYSQKLNFDLHKATEQEIRKFMIENRIGVDCSAFVAWTLNEITKQKLNKPIWKCIDFQPQTLRRRIASWLRPIENIGVTTLYNNSTPILDITKIQVGDMIVGWNIEHVILITKIEYNEQNIPTSFEYVSSTWWYGNQNGMIKGTVNITQPDKYLADQHWEEKTISTDKNWTLEGIKWNNAGKIIRIVSLQ